MGDKQWQWRQQMQTEGQAASVVQASLAVYYRVCNAAMSDDILKAQMSAATVTDAMPPHSQACVLPGAWQTRLWMRHPGCH